MDVEDILRTRKPVVLLILMALSLLACVPLRLLGLQVPRLRRLLVVPKEVLVLRRRSQCVDVE